MFINEKIEKKFLKTVKEDTSLINDIDLNKYKQININISFFISNNYFNIILIFFYYCFNYSF